MQKKKDNREVMAAMPGSGPSSAKKKIENVLILQGGGSLGAFGCGVFKALANRNIKPDIIAGTSIGGVNAAIIAGSKNKDNAELLLEQFWLEVAESHVDMDKLTPFSPFNFMQQTLSSYYFYSPSSFAADQPFNIKKEVIKQIKSFYSSAIFGNNKMFRPRWMRQDAFSDPDYFKPDKWTFLYDHSPLAKTLEKYIDYERLKPGGNSSSRLIMTAVNVLTSEPLVFDSYRHKITPKHILATCSYPLYNLPWTEVEDGVYAWDGGLLSNTPLREVIDASPVNDKIIFLVENYPKKIDALPKNLAEVYHRARDIMFCDKTKHSIKMSKVITSYLNYIEELYQIIENSKDVINIDKEQMKRIRHKYKIYKEQHGAEIKDIFYITREEHFPHFYENADFSVQTIKKAINDGQTKTIEILKEVV